MQRVILEAIEEVWRTQCTALVEALAEAMGALEELVRLDDYHRHGHDPDRLAHAMGPLADSSVDLGSLSRVLASRRGPSAMGPERLQRVQQLIVALGEMKHSWSAMPLQDACVAMGAGGAELGKRAEAYMNRLAKVFGSLRVAQLEIHSRYRPEAHDATLSSFDWRQLGPGELQTAPPFVVLATLDGDSSALLLELVSLLETGIPLKVVAARSSLRRNFLGTLDTRVPSKLTLETLPLALRGVYFIQTFVGATDFQEQLADALAAPRPALISLLCPRPEEAQDAFSARADRAIRARAFPLCLYDPDRHERFVSCFDLRGNPSPEYAWTTEAIGGLEREGHLVEREEAFTLAHFASTDDELAAELTEPPEAADSLVHLTEYLGFSRRQQLGKLPFIYLRGREGRVVRKVVSPQLAQQCAERLHLWRTLQELCGIDNPYLEATRVALQRELDAERQAELDGLRGEMEKYAVRREKTAIASTVRKLVAELTGIEPSRN